MSLGVSDRTLVPLGENIGEIDGKPMGPKLFRGTWNSELYDELKPFAQKGVDAGTDVLIWKNRFSALHGQQPLETYLNDQGINSVFVCGVMTDVCVYGTWLDAYYKVNRIPCDLGSEVRLRLLQGYDAVYISDLSCTHNPQFVTQAAHLSAEGEYHELTESSDADTRSSGLARRLECHHFWSFNLMKCIYGLDLDLLWGRLFGTFSENVKCTLVAT